MRKNTKDLFSGTGFIVKETVGLFWLKQGIAPNVKSAELNSIISFRLNLVEMMNIVIMF